ncbi:MAG: hypothetical protein ACYS6W_00270 [Planctomycetota bacterium]|jgi:hypothetical protein
MVRKINYGKILLVIFLTVLIWVWADLALDEEHTIPSVTLSVAKSTDMSLWVSFNEEPAVSVDNVMLKGPASKIRDVRRRLNDGSLILRFFLDAGQEGMVNPGEYPLDVLNFLKQSRQIKDLGLTVESCKPDKLSVNVVKLTKKSLTVKCFDEDGNPLKAESIEPSKVDMFVPEDWEGEALTAKVRLTRSEVGQARVEAVPKKPYIELAPGQIREAAGTVDITASPEENRLIDDTITPATLGITFSPTLLGKYDVEIENLPEVIGGITIRATPDAKRAYEDMRYQVILEIDDKDARSTEPLIRKELIYNFPAEYVRKDEIELKNPDQPVVARFKLIRLPSAVAPSNE